MTAWSPILPYLQETCIAAKQRGRPAVTKPTRVAQGGNKTRAEIRNKMFKVTCNAGSYHVVAGRQREDREQNHASPGQQSK